MTSMITDFHLPAIWHLTIKNNFPLFKNRLIGLLCILTISGIILLIWLSDMKYVSNFNDVIYEQSDIIIDYGVVLDCGSSGTRVFVYFWQRQHHPDTNTLLNMKPLLDKHGYPVQLKVEPGLSSFASNPSGVGDHVKPLLDLAASHIPSDRHAETVLYMLATAGMRMLAQSDQDSILSHLRQSVPSISPFVFSDSHADIISGKEEGIYAWISANYVLNRLKVDKSGKRDPTVGVIDMGGGSIQIAFEIPDTHGVSQNSSAKFNLGTTGDELEYSLFVTTHLGFGANVANTKHQQALLKNATEKIIPDPCYPPGLSVPVSGDFELSGVGDFDSCYSSLFPLLNKSTSGCSTSDSCSLDGSFQPSLDSTSEFFGFSEFYYTSEDCLKIAGEWNIQKFREKSREYCATQWSQIRQNWNNKLYKADENRIKNQCFKSAWVSLVLHEGLNFPESGKKLTSLQTINGTEAQWALGALIYRTRFLPLRDDHGVDGHYSAPATVTVIDNSLVLLVLCITFVVGLLLLHIKRIISAHRSTIYVRLPSRRRLEEDIV